MAVNISANGYETILFAWSGRTMIGKIWLESNVKQSDVSPDTIIGSMNVGDCYMIYNPCEIVYNLTVPPSGSAEMTWTLKPYFYKNLIADSGVSYAAFAFPKSEVALSNIGGTTIHPNILSAYKELVG